MIQSIGVRELQVRLSAVLDAVRGGATYEVTRHRATVAYVVPASSIQLIDRAHRTVRQLAELEERLSLAEARLSTAEAERDAANMARLAAEARADESSEEVTALRELTDGRSPAARRRLR